MRNRTIGTSFAILAVFAQQPTAFAATGCCVYASVANGRCGDTDFDGWISCEGGTFTSTCFNGVEDRDCPTSNSSSTCTALRQSPCSSYIVNFWQVECSEVASCNRALSESTQDQRSPASSESTVEVQSLLSYRGNPSSLAGRAPIVTER